MKRKAYHAPTEDITQQDWNWAAQTVFQSNLRRQPWFKFWFWDGVTQINTAELWKPLTCAQTRVPCTATVYSSNKPSNQPPCWGGQNAFRQDTGKCFALSEVTCWGINSNNFKSSMKEERARRRVLLRLNGRDGSVLSLVGFISLLSLTLPHTQTTAPSEIHLT